MYHLCVLFAHPESLIMDINKLCLKLQSQLDTSDQLAKDHFIPKSACLNLTRGTSTHLKEHFHDDLKPITEASKQAVAVTQLSLKQIIQ